MILFGANIRFNRYFVREIYRLFRNLYSTRHRIREYGFRYLYDKEYRRIVKQRIKGKKVRLKYGSGFLSRVPKIKSVLIRRDGRCCDFCLKRFEFLELTVDHVIPISKGGTNNMDNLRLLCVECHKYKTKYIDSIKKSFDPYEKST